MKVLIATAKPFAAEAVQGIKKEFEGTGHEVVLLEKYETNEQLLDAVKDVDAMIVRSDKITAEVHRRCQELEDCRSRWCRLRFYRLPVCQGEERRRREHAGSERQRRG